MSFIIDPFKFSSFTITPPDLAGLIRWYKADTFSLADGTSIGQAGVTPWVDQSTAAVDLTQATAGARPVYKTNIFGSMPSVRFDGIDDFLTQSATLSLAGAFTFLCVGTFTTDGMLFGNSAANEQVRILRGGANVISFFAGTGEIVSSVFGTAASAIGTKIWLRDGSNNMEFRENKTDRTAVPTADISTLDSDVMGQGNGGSFLTGNIGEVCVWNQRHTNANLDLLYDGYLKIRYPSLP